jgi:hypothetical protein
MSGRALFVAACLVLLAPGVGTAAPARCPQLVDPAGDQNPVTDPAADLLGVALGSDRSSLRLLLRYAGEQQEATPVTGHDYSVDLNTGEGGLTAQALVSPTGPSFALYRHGPSAGDENASASGGTGVGRLQGVVDAKAHTVTMTIPFAMAADLLRPRQALTVSASVFTSVMSPDIEPAGRAFTGQGSDRSDAPVVYRLGTKSC